MSAGGAQTTWVRGSWDPLCGCSPLSDGCTNCPACASLRRRGIPEGVIWPNTVAEWEKVYRLKPDLYLLCSSSDLFIEGAEPFWERIVERLKARPDVIFVVLTKRLAQAKKFVDRFGVLKNLWLGTSAEDQWHLDERVPELYSIPAAGYVLSLQPLLAPLFLARYLRNKKLKKVVTGCELGPKARPCKKAWLDQIERQCQKHGVWCFITRYKDENGKTVTAGTENGPRWCNRKDRPGFRPTSVRKNLPTVLSLMGGLRA